VSSSDDGNDKEEEEAAPPPEDYGVFIFFEILFFSDFCFSVQAT
jgi:hypothetical protein